MTNKFGIPKEESIRIRTRDKTCVYCHKKMIYPFISSKYRDCATIEHLNYDGPFYWKDGLQIEDIVICCGECNSSRGTKELLNWFKNEYCLTKNINENTVVQPVKNYLNRKRKK
ncbi:MAG: hypothetical protein AABW72_03130 [archaeon]